MLRIHFIQHWFNLADLSCEEALYDSASLRSFVGIDLGCEPVPDSTSITKFRKLLNDNKLGEALFAKVGQKLQARGFKVNTGTIVDTMPTVFDGYIERSAKVSSTCLVAVARNRYSVPCELAGQRVSTRTHRADADAYGPVHPG